MSERTFVFISSSGKIWQKTDLNRDDVVADLKFATLFITLAQGVSVSIIEDTLSQASVDAAAKFLNARDLKTPILVMWWKTHADWAQNSKPKGERKALISAAEFGSKVGPVSVVQKGTGGTFTEKQIRKAARRASPVRDGIPTEFQALWRMCKIVDGFVSTSMQSLLDRELRFRMGFSSKVLDSVVQYKNDQWVVELEYVEDRNGSKVTISKNTAVTAGRGAPPPRAGSAPMDKRVEDALAEFATTYQEYHPLRGIAGDIKVSTKFRLDDLKNQIRGQRPEYALDIIRAEIEDLTAYIEKHKPAVPAAAKSKSKKQTEPPPQGFVHVNEVPPIKVKNNSLVFYKANEKNTAILKQYIKTGFKGVKSGSNKNAQDSVLVALKSAVKHDKPHIVIATYMGWKIRFIDDSAAAATFNLQGGFILMPNGDWWSARVEL